MTTLDLSSSDVADLMGVKRQAVDKWLLAGPPVDRMQKIGAIAEIADLLRYRLRDGMAAVVARRGAEAYGGRSMLELIAQDEHEWLRQSVKESFDFTRVALNMRTVPLADIYYRVADPDWADPLDPSFAAADAGQRWNPPGLPCLYLNRDEATSRANVMHLYAGLPYGPEDLDPATAPLLLVVSLPGGAAADAFTDEGLLELGLPTVPAGGERSSHPARRLPTCRPRSFRCGTGRRGLPIGCRWREP